MLRTAAGYASTAALGGAAVYLLMKKSQANCESSNKLLKTDIDKKMSKETHPVAMHEPANKGPPKCAVNIGEVLPSTKLHEMQEGKMKTDVTLADVFGGKKGVLVSIPGAFTPG